MIFSIGMPRNSTIAEKLKKEEERYQDFLHIDVEDYYELLSYRVKKVLYFQENGTRIFSSGRITGVNFRVTR